MDKLTSGSAEPYFPGLLFEFTPWLDWPSYALWDHCLPFIFTSLLDQIFDKKSKYIAKILMLDS